MSNILWKSLALSQAVFGASLLVSTTAIAAPSTSESQVVSTEVSQAEKPETETPSVFSASFESQETQTLAQSQQNQDVNVLQEVNQYSSEGQQNGSQSQVTSLLY